MGVDLVWFRRDLRLADNPAWSAGTAGQRVCALFVIDPRLFTRVAAHRRAALVAALRSLDDTLRDRGGRLRIERGDPATVVPAVAAEVGAGSVHLNREVTPFGRERDARVEAALSVPVVGHHGVHLHAPGSVTTAAGAPYRLFTPFHRSWAERDPPLVPEPGGASVIGHPGSGIPETHPPIMAMGEAAAGRRLDGFLERVDRYGEERDRPDLDSTSRLSVDLKYGTLGPLTVRLRVGTHTESRRALVRQLAWRDFYAHLMEARPDSVSASIRPELAHIDWNHDPDGVAAWKRGMTGYPIIDAGMRQLAAEGWIHNRVRMLVASFLVKDLLVDWRIGERYLRRMLLDGDTAQNVGNWQWVAGTGTDAAPYFRVFNPVTQSARFDPDGSYITRWVPELSGLPSASVHAPWELGPLELAAAGVTLGDTYPAPIVDHAAARRRTLDAYRRSRTARN